MRPDDPRPTDPHGGHRTRALALAGLVLLAILALVLMPRIGQGPVPQGAGEGDDDQELTTAQEKQVRTAATDTLESALPTTAGIDPDHPTDMSARLAEVAGPDYLSDLESEQLEFVSQGWSRTGSYSVGDVEVLSFSEKGQKDTATVRACIDSSDLTVTRKDGKHITANTDSDRTWNIFALTRTGDGPWKITSRSMPDDPTC